MSMDYGKIGRLIAEGEYPHSADWHSLWLALTSRGYIVEGTGGECEVTTVGDLEIQVDSGAVQLGGERYDRASGDEQTETVSSNSGEAHGRYDVVYLVEGTGDDWNLVVEEGTPAEEPEHPDLPDVNEQLYVPVAVLWLSEDSSVIDNVKDVRSIREGFMWDSDKIVVTKENMRTGVESDGSSGYLICDAGKLGTYLEESGGIFDATGLADETAFNNHNARHEDGGADEVQVENLPTNLADNQILETSGGSLTSSLPPLFYQSEATIKSWADDATKMETIATAPMAMDTMCSSEFMLPLLLQGSEYNKLYGEKDRSKWIFCHGHPDGYDRDYWWYDQVKLSVVDVYLGSIQRISGPDKTWDMHIEGAGGTGTEGISLYMELSDYSTLHFRRLWNQNLRDSFKAVVVLNGTTEWELDWGATYPENESIDISGYSGVVRVKFGVEASDGVDSVYYNWTVGQVWLG